MASPDIQFEIIPTPSPSEIQIRVWQDANQMSLDTIPAIGTAYGDTTLPVSPKLLEYTAYKYVAMTKDGDDLWFYFGKPKTTTEKNTPFRTYYDNRQYTWPSVLEDLYAVESSVFPQAVNNGTTTDTTPSIFPRYKYRPAVPYNSLVMVEQFLAPEPWNPHDLIHPQPVPTDVNGSYVGVSMNYERCLHGTMVFEEKVPAATIIYGVGSLVPPIGRNPRKQIFPETNFTDWAEFFIEDRQQPVNGLWLRERVKIFPPPIPEPILA